MTDWLAKLPPNDKKKTLNTIKYEYKVCGIGISGTGTVLHLAAICNQLAIAKLLLDEGAGIAHTSIQGA